METSEEELAEEFVQDGDLKCDGDDKSPLLYMTSIVESCQLGEGFSLGFMTLLPRRGKYVFDSSAAMFDHLSQTSRVSDALHFLS